MAERQCAPAYGGGEHDVGPIQFIERIETKRVETPTASGGVRGFGGACAIDGGPRAIAARAMRAAKARLLRRLGRRAAADPADAANEDVCRAPNVIVGYPAHRRARSTRSTWRLCRVRKNRGAELSEIKGAMPYRLAPAQSNQAEIVPDLFGARRAITVRTSGVSPWRQPPR
jgi:hypothetical protein